MKTKLILHIPHSTRLTACSGWNDSEKLIELSNKWTDHYTDCIFNPNQINNTEIDRVIFNENRFNVDVERLINDDLEKIGQGILYTNFGGIERTLDKEERENLMELYYAHHKKLKDSIEDCKTIVVDCHSFPSELSEVDFCIGFNNDLSKPSDEMIEGITQLFEKRNYKIGINNPYSNSINPLSDKEIAERENPYCSFMIEINKKLYLNDSNNKSISLKSDFYKVKNMIDSVLKYVCSF